MNTNPSDFTLNRETLRQLEAPAEPKDGRNPTTTVLTRYVSCTAC